MTSRTLIVLTTGGTIEKTYDEHDGSLQNRETILEREVCKRLRLPYTHLQVFSIMSKDSLDMTQEDRAAIAQQVQGYLSQGHPIVIIHGTDTMAVTAEYLLAVIPAPAVPVILTGAMRPLGMQDSDAFQNVAEAFMAAQLAAPGIYISFHNQLFPAGQVQKNLQRLTFEWKA
jgi:L-asparaginase